MSDDIKVVVEASQRIEAALERAYAAQGRGLHEKVTSVEAKLPPKLVHDIRFIASVRNKVVHQKPEMDCATRASFCAVSAQIIQTLETASGSQQNHGKSASRTGVGLQQPSVAELLAVMLPLYGGDRVLGPGQLVPLWDIGAWGRTKVEFEVQGYFAASQNDELVCTGENYTIDSLESLAVLEETGQLGTDLSQRMAYATAEQSVLGDVGGLWTVRPDALPVGMLPVVGRHGLGGPCIEEQSMSALEFHKLARTCNRTAEPPPKLQFFASSKSGAAAGWDVATQGSVKVEPLPAIPMSFSPAQSLGLLTQADVHGYHFLTSMLAAVSQMLKGLSIAKGFIYAGFEMGNTAVEEKQWGIGDLNAGIELPMYALPWQVDPLNALTPRAKSQAEAMIRGDFRRSPLGRTTLFKR